MPRTAVPAASWLTDTQEQPRADALSGNRIRRRARFYRVYLLSAALLCPLLLLALAAAVSGSLSTGIATTPERDWPGRAAATQTVLGWLSGPNPGLPEGRLLQWSGARIETPATEAAETSSTGFGATPMSSVSTHVTMLASANHVGRRSARCASMIATPANAAKSRIVRKARPMMPFCVPTSTQMTHTIAAAMSAPIATQIAARTSGELDESSLAESAWWPGAVMTFLSSAGRPA